MRITSLCGTDVKGCTYNIKNIFLEEFPEAEITEFYLPSSGPDFCTGCKNCFNKGEAYCPNKDKVEPIWQAILEQVKTLLDHFGCHWFAHRPEARMFNKHAAIITQSIGAPNGSARHKEISKQAFSGLAYPKSKR